jgi:hypothetical protein
LLLWGLLAFNESTYWYTENFKLWTLSFRHRLRQESLLISVVVVRVVLQPATVADLCYVERTQYELGIKM